MHAYGRHNCDAELAYRKLNSEDGGTRSKHDYYYVAYVLLVQLWWMLTKSGSHTLIATRWWCIFVCETSDQLLKHR